MSHASTHSGAHVQSGSLWIRRFRWVIGTPYFVQGTSNLSEIPILYFIKFSLGMGDAGGQLFDSVKSAGWLIKPVWGYISDTIPLFGYRRKSWFVAMAFLATAFWAINAAMAALGVTLPWLFLITFNLAFATYAFVDVVCDAIMVTEGRRRGRVGHFVNFQWTVLAVANAGAVLAGGWLQGTIEESFVDPALIFLLTGLPPLITAVVGLRHIEEEKVPATKPFRRLRRIRLLASAGAAGRWLWRAPGRFGAFRRRHRTIWLLVLFLFFWKFSPSVGYIERSYLIDERGFDPSAFAIILSAGSIVFLFSILVYVWLTRRFGRIEWHHYLYAMVAIGVLAFPLSFYLYLDPGHPWWNLFEFSLPAGLDPMPGWDRYEWFWLILQSLLGFATIPAFIVPLTIAGETVQVSYAGIGYAFLMSLANVTTVLEGVVGAGLFSLFSLPSMAWLLDAFRGSWLEIAGAEDARTLILQLFVYISLFFTLLTIPFIVMLRRELRREGIEIRLDRRPEQEREQS